MNKECTICHRIDQPWFSKKRCKSCASKQDAKPLKRTEIVKKAYTIPKQTEKNKVHRKSLSAQRDLYFDYHIHTCTASEESGTSIHNPWRGNICHLFDKSRHPSLQSNLENYIYLTLDEHTDFDRLLYSHDFVKLEQKFKNSWQIACKRMKDLLPLCLEKTKFYFKIKEYLEDGRDN